MTNKERVVNRRYKSLHASLQRYIPRSTRREFVFCSDGCLYIVRSHIPLLSGHLDYQVK
jgi:hypothetical protein